MKLPEFELERYFARYEFDMPYLLSSSDMEGYRLDELLELADEECLGLWENLSLGYTESAGHPLLREEVSSLYEHSTADDVLVFTGAEEAIFAFANVALGPGDHAVVTWPAYQSLHEVARATGAEVTLLELRHEEGWGLDPDRLASAVRSDTKAIVVNFPHNPTGYLPDHETFKAVVGIAREAGAYLFSDEVYRLLEHDPDDRLPAATAVYERAVSLGVTSKAFALAGLRIGWIATRDEELMKGLARFKDYTTICNSAPSEVLALIALRARDDILARNMSIIRENLPDADRFFAEWEGAFEWVRPKVGCIGFPRLLADETIDAFAAALAEDEGVMLLPGTTYGYPPGSGNHFRLGLGRRDFPEALRRMERFAAWRLRGQRTVAASGWS
jgi:aspartate/methionine/tyrosine aminotransferase